MISENIKNLRREKGLTQKELADLLHVTSQAVSRWEKGEVEPSVDTISGMAKIFEVTTDEIIDGPDKKPKPEVITEVQEKIVVEQGKPVLTICENCKRPIYESSEIVTQTRRHGRSPSTTHYICTDCDKKIKAKQKQDAINYGISQRKKSFVWATIISVVVLVIGIAVAVNSSGVGGILGAIFLPILSFTFVSCLFLKNNFVGDTFLAIASWGVVEFPGLIFSFDLDGFAWLIGMKILFWILGFVLGFLAILLALVVCMPLSAIAYPFALKKSFSNPELTDSI